MRSRHLTLIGVACAAAVAASQGSAQPQTTMPTVVVPIKITMTDAGIRVSPKSAPRAALGHFILTNRGTKQHAFTLARTRFEFGTQRGFTVSLKPGRREVVQLYLDYRGRLAYRGSLPADRGKAGMRGFFRVY
jgi:hypothetical protein